MVSKIIATLRVVKLHAHHKMCKVSSRMSKQSAELTECINQTTKDWLNWTDMAFGCFDLSRKIIKTVDYQMCNLIAVT